MESAVSRKTTNLEQLTDEEAAVYDRQIRLWGVESQKRLRKSRILIAGLNGIGNEVCKNVILAGVHHVTVLDSTSLSERDIDGQFLAPRGDVGRNRAEASLQRAQNLNPMVDLVIDTDDIITKPEDFFSKFDVVCLFGFNKDIMLKVSKFCHDQKVKFLCGDVFGKYGYSFSDFGVHEFLQEKPKVTKATLSDGKGPEAKKAKLDAENKEPEMEEKVAEFVSLADALSVDFCKTMNLKRVKAVPKACFIMQVMLAFSQEYGCYPSYPITAKVWDQLIEIRNDVMEALKVDNDVLPDDILSSCIGVLYPVCCIVGGVLAQEVIKAVSGKDAPHNNTFLFDGDTSAGVIEKIGPS